MCFSATSSFSAAALLTAGGIFAIKNTPSKQYYLLAIIPLLFAIQQASEGIVWLTYNNIKMAVLTNAAAHVFLIFAFLIWPLWIPSSLFFLEKSKFRKKLLGIIFIIGILLFLTGLYTISFYKETVNISVHNIQYHINYPNFISTNFYLIIYACTTILPFFISSLKEGTISGSFLFLSLIFTYLFMLNTFISVWCFFAAIISLMILVILRKNKKTLIKNN